MRAYVSGVHHDVRVLPLKSGRHLLMLVLLVVVELIDDQLDFELRLNIRLLATLCFSLKTLKKSHNPPPKYYHTKKS
jgi:hypothetical protein